MREADSRQGAGEKGALLERVEVLPLLWENPERLNHWIQNPGFMPPERLRQCVYIM